MISIGTSYKAFCRTLPHKVIRLENWFRENRRPLRELIIVLMFIGLAVSLIVATDVSEALFGYAREHENGHLDDLVLSLAVTSFFLAIFATRQWIESIKFLHRSNTDSLTGLNNRRKGWEVLEREIQRARRYQRPLSLIMFDIDFYKEFNDSLGHQTGDGILKKVAKTVQDRLRVSDTLVRWGGDEFLIISIETDLSTSRTLAERLRTTIENCSVQGLWNITASFGVTQFEQDDDYNSLTRRVDEQLYKAKTQGKNRVA
ncbi:MAG: GGDEF domain-containing protein [Anaerolineales bacterium]|nr:GGDEF domain-containing protein [Anaerolineales bacterium]